ncbi:MAG TPA: S8 family serine peptidase [Ilumatobacteraceae bacterium]|nr:S8 family serine peptidase [Ilumatobacteraceae bacterium]
MAEIKMARGATWGGRPVRPRRMVTKGRVVAAVLAIGTVAPILCTSSFASAASYDPNLDAYSMKAMTENIGATAFWNQGITGAGVDVAVIDTGVAPVEGLATPNKIINGPDLSLESQAPNLAHLDTNGHGTFIAGLIAGKDSTLQQPYSNAPAGQYRGIAPDARIVSVKVGTADGGVDVTQMIAAINWVVDHRHDNGMNIRVLNLSYGTNSTQPSLVDPLSYAAERAWKAGIVVVAAAGNTGFQRGVGAPGLADPAYNPNVLAVGGYDTKGTAFDFDDTVGAYSASSNVRGARKPDLVAVGTKLQGLRVPNSFIDANHPEGLLGTRFFRGSGTSEAAAITSGTVALLLQKYPNMTPDQVKGFLKGQAKDLFFAFPSSQGEGSLDLWRLANYTPSTYPTQEFAPATGTGSVELSRGRDHLTKDGVILQGEVDIFGKPFTSATAGSSWSGGQWNGSTWSGSTWSGSTWSGSTWSGSTWSGSSWSGSSWSGSSWSGDLWG